MRERFEVRRQARARVIATGRHVGVIPRWVWAILLIGSCGATPIFAQPVAGPEKEAPTLPPGAGGDQGLSTPRSESPTIPLDGIWPVPDQGVVAPLAGGATPVIRPPSAGTMPVTPPPGSSGGDKRVVPK
jgi:hypothetical protein